MNNNTILSNIIRHIKYIFISILYNRSYRLIKKSRYFNKEWYIANYHDIDKPGVNPAVHYLMYGWKENREPSGDFAGWKYFEKYPDVRKANINPLLHYEKYGKKEGRNITYNSNNYSRCFFVLADLIQQIKSQNFNQRIILLVSHNLSLTGAPRAIINMAKEIRKNGDIPVIAAFTPGPMEEEIKNEGILLVYINRMDVEKEFKGEKLFSFFNIFDYIVFNTIVTLELAEKIAHTNPTKIAWIHEAEYEFAKAEERKQNLYRGFEAIDYIYSVGNYSKKYTDRYLKNRKSDILLYSIKDMLNNKENEIKEKREKLIFAMVGALSERKGHLVLIEAINYLPIDILNSIEFWIIGPQGEKKVAEKVQDVQTDYFKYFGPMPYEKLMKTMEEIDVILCPSLDDPMPMVVTEAMMQKKVVLVTENTGTASLIDNGINGFVVKTNNPKALADKIKEIYINKSELNNIGEKGRNIYEDYFTENYFTENVKKIFDQNKIINRSYEYIPRNKNVKLFDVEIENNEVKLIVSVGILNNIYIKLGKKLIYGESEELSINHKCFNEYLNTLNEKLLVFKIDKNTMKNKIAFFDEYEDSLNITISNYINMYYLSQTGTYITKNGNILEINTKIQFIVKKFMDCRYNIINKISLLYIMIPKKLKYNLYFETLNNHNDNAYELFIKDLKEEKNKNAYFITSKEVYENEEDMEIKKHIIIFNSPKHKKFALRAKKMIVSWWCFPIFGSKKMDIYYPFLNYNYVAVLHGISYDKNSYYLNYLNFGKNIPTYCCSEYEKVYLEEINGYSNVKVLGYPRMDKWIKYSNNDENMVFLFPTWRKDITRDYIRNIEDICRQISSSFPNKFIVYAAHPSIPQSIYLEIKEILDNIGGNILSISSIDGQLFNKYFSTAKYLITDYSSVAYDHAYKEDGISIYYIPDEIENKHYQLRDVFYEGHCGIIAKNIEDIKEIINDKYDNKKLNERKENFFKYIDYNNTERVFRDIFKK
ncbi:glycosyltransferase [uncultured Clostridium sp.]|uniref:glycosyltransferase n=1 Tax=uncultured Clostridium sp. TaxID=59620 RepID=UPI0025DA37B8|nr:glycosyltransferase [uncultured Clostridium sp.]